jgi:hypothetical protein
MLSGDKKVYNISKVYKKQGKSKEKVARKCETCYTQ